MPKKSVCFIILFAMLISALGLFAYADNTPAVSASCAVLIDADSAEVLFSKDDKRHMPMASTTKIMTALVIIEECDLSQIVSVDKRACGVEGSSVYLKAEQKISMQELLYALMLESANDAATELALCAGEGDIDAFVFKMNEKAKQIGMTNTCFENPSGLPQDGHYSCAYDMALLMRVAMQNESFRKITSTYRYECKSLGRLFVNHNRLLISYDGCNGGKTGYTKKSGRCLVSSACRDNTNFICVTLNAPGDWNDHRLLYDSAFEQYVSYELVCRGQYGFSVPVVNSDATTLYCEANPQRRLLKKDDASSVHVTTNLHRFYYGGISKGEKVGEMVFYIADREIARSDIIASCDCDNIIYMNIFEKLLSFFIKD